MIQEKQLIENSNATFIQITISKLIKLCITYVVTLYIIMMYNNYNFLVWKCCNIIADYNRFNCVVL